MIWNDFYMKKIVASFIIPSFNSARYLGRTINSVINTCTVPYEIIIVDDCSDDIDELVALTTPITNCILMRKSVRSNAAASRNIGYKESKGEFVFFLDSDDVFLEGHICRRIAAHRNEKVGTIFGRFLVLFDGGKSLRREVPPYEEGCLRRYLFIGRGDIRSSTISICKTYFNGRLFDEEQRKHQDWGFGIRNADAGEKLSFDKCYGVALDAARPNRMSGSLNIEASQYFLREYGISGDCLFGFVRSQIFTAIRLGDHNALQFMRAELRRHIYAMSCRYKIKTALLLLFTLPLLAGTVTAAQSFKKGLFSKMTRIW